MRGNTVRDSWVVYRMTLRKNVPGGNVVCEQWEWEAVEASRPGYHTLLYSGIGTEQEAEKLARGTAGDAFRRVSGKKKAAPAPAAPPAAP